MLKPTPQELFKSSYKSIFKNKSRTILTSLGIIIGVSSVILLTAIGNGLKSYITQQFDELGANTIFVSPGKLFNSNGGFSRNESDYMVSLTFDQKDVKSLTRGLASLVSHIAPVGQVSSTIKYKNQQQDTTIVIVPSNYQQINQFKLENGRWYTQIEDDKKDKLAILGHKIATELFPNLDPISKSITLQGKNYKIIGVLEKQGGSFGGPNYDSYTFIPFQTGENLIDGKIQTISIKAKTKEDVPQVINQAESILLDRYEKDTFTVFDSSQLLNSINSILSTLTIALSGIAAISLVVGGIGIMNIMLVTVTERTREIGLRKAVGAYPRAILLQFLFEAVILSSVGGIIGIILGSLGSVLINNFFPSTVTFTSVLLAFGVSSMVGIIFGVTPARKASQLDPIQALRHE